MAEIADALKSRREISITVTGRRSGKQITIPVWFVSDQTALWLLPVYGSNTQWYQNLQKNRAITIEAGNERRKLRV
jgi:deazaflavin-dependent oxidoreductase (nitroreductase family)